MIGADSIVKWVSYYAIMLSTRKSHVARYSPNEIMVQLEGAPNYSIIRIREVPLYSGTGDF